MGMLNAVGLQNDGVEAFLTHKLPRLPWQEVPVIANIYAVSADEFGELAGVLSREDGVAALEVNISCPNVHEGGVLFGQNPIMAARVVEAVKARAGNKPVIVKLSPNVTDITDIARAVEEAGADALSCINTLTGMAVDLPSRRPLLANVVGGLSGPAIKPVALRCVWQVCRAVTIPVIGVGALLRPAMCWNFCWWARTPCKSVRRVFPTPPPSSAWWMNCPPCARSSVSTIWTSFPGSYGVCKRLLHLCFGRRRRGRTRRTRPGFAWRALSRAAGGELRRTRWPRRLVMPKVEGLAPAGAAADSAAVGEVHSRLCQSEAKARLRHDPGGSVKFAGQSMGPDGQYDVQYRPILAAFLSVHPCRGSSAYSWGWGTRYADPAPGWFSAPARASRIPGTFR